MIGDTGAGRPVLTRRELQVLQGLAEGLWYADIAARLGVRPTTVSMTAVRVYRRLGVSGDGRSALRAVSAGYRLGLLRVPCERCGGGELP